jgi:hypothetical protein
MSSSDWGASFGRVALNKCSLEFAGFLVICEVFSVGFIPELCDVDLLRSIGTVLSNGRRLLSEGIIIPFLISSTFFADRAVGF